MVNLDFASNLDFCLCSARLEPWIISYSAANWLCRMSVMRQTMVMFLWNPLSLQFWNKEKKSTMRWDFQELGSYLQAHKLICHNFMWVWALKVLSERESLITHNESSSQSICIFMPVLRALFQQDNAKWAYNVGACRACSIGGELEQREAKSFIIGSNPAWPLLQTRYSLYPPRLLASLPFVPEEKL